MALFFLSYDVQKGHSYQPLYDELTRLGAKPVLESVWCFEFPGGACGTIRDHSLTFLRSGDRLLVTRAEEYSAWATISTVPQTQPPTA